MSWAEQVVKGGEQKILQPRMLIYGAAGVGKSSYGAKLPKPVFIDLDKGIDDVNVDRVRAPATWTDALNLVRAIAADPRGYKSLVIDTVDPLEELAVQHVLKISNKASLSDFEFGAGYNAVAMEWKLFLAELDVARQNGLLVCLLGHAMVREAHDPTLGAFDQFTSQLGKKSWALTQRWADLVGFAAFDVALAQKKGEDARVLVTGKRYLYTVRGSGYEAKNRFGMQPKLDLSWEAVEAGIARHRQPPEVLEAKILALAKGTEFEEKARGYVDGAAKDVNKLLEVETALRTKLEAMKVDVVPAAKLDTTDPAVQRTNIRTRVRELAAKVGGDATSKAEGYLSKAGDDLKELLKIEEGLHKKLNGTQATA
jgi:AAA domain